MVGRVVLVVMLVAACAAQAASTYPVAGVQPDRRPENAPVIRDYARPSEDRFFYGVDKPRPASLAWFANQGAWYTPFNRPGMPGRYDIRGWHKNSKDGRRQ